MLRLRPALITDLDFLVNYDLACEPHGPSNGRGNATDHRYCMASYVTDLDKEAWVVEDSRAERPVAMLLCWFRNRWRDKFDPSSVILRLDDRLFPPDGGFCEVCQLYVDAGYRRQGVATSLKQRLEYESFTRGAGLIYTHTTAANTAALELNKKMGYQVVRRGPLWDDTIRISMTKRLR
jgi:ribosomal protein S18 acetylase RimI-like enzyme